MVRPNVCWPSCAVRQLVRSAKHLHLSRGAGADPGHRGPRSSEKGLPDADAAHLQDDASAATTVFRPIGCAGCNGWTSLQRQSTAPRWGHGSVCAATTPRLPSVAWRRSPGPSDQNRKYGWDESRTVDVAPSLLWTTDASQRQSVLMRPDCHQVMRHRPTPPPSVPWPPGTRSSCWP